MLKISSNILRIDKVAKAKTAFATLGVLCLMSCVSETSGDVTEIFDANPMRFSTSNIAQNISQTRADLTQGFKVSCWKNYGNTTTQQTVMYGYEVQYNNTVTSGSKWSYEKVTGQYLKYWDLSSYPYEFRAVTPALTSTTIGNTQLTIDLTSQGSTTFKAQTFTNGTVSPDLASSEPCMIAQVSRVKDADGKYIDTDLLSAKEDKTINTTNQDNPTREVNLPFHHLMSKVGFRFYIDDPTVPAYAITLSDVEISVKNVATGESFITESNRYEATNSSTSLLNGSYTPAANGTFTPSDAHPTFPLLTMSGESNKYSKSAGQWSHLSAPTAYDFGLTQGGNDDLIQIPQSNLKIHVKMTLTYGNGSTETIDTWISSDGPKPEAYAEVYSWLPNTHYIYYLHIKNLEKYPIIVCTAQVAPWDIVKTADIPIGL